MEQEFTFIDINDKERRGVRFFVVMQDGEEYVEAMVVGKKGKWVEWYPLTGFQMRNPEMVLMKKPTNFGE